MIDTATQNIVATVNDDNGPSAVAVSPDGNHAYVTNGLNTVSVISLIPTS